MTIPDEIGMDVEFIRDGMRVRGRVEQTQNGKYQVECNHERIWLDEDEILEWIYPDDWEGPIII